MEARETALQGVSKAHSHSAKLRRNIHLLTLVWGLLTRWG